MRDLIAALNHASAEFPAVWSRDLEPAGFQWLDADDADHSLYAFLRWGVAGESAVACIANFTPVPRPGYRLGLPWGGPWRVVLDTDAAAWWGSGHRGDVDVVEGADEAWQGVGASAVLDVGPMSMLWLAADAPR